MRIALVPLDDRPCHTRFPRRLAQAAGIELLTPPTELLGWFDRPGDPAGVLDWLEDVAPQVDGAGICAEMVACGGLVASRRSISPSSEVSDRLDRLGRILSGVDGPVHLGSVIMRATVTVTSDDRMDAYTKIARYSELREPADAGDSAAMVEIQDIEQSLPSGILEEFLAARERNHQANARCVVLLHRGAADSLILTQEDCRPRGLHRSEQRALLGLADARGVAGRVLLHPGADELSAVLLARVAVDAAGAQPAARLVILPGGAEGRIAPFEDKPILRTVQGQAAAAGLGLTEDPGAPQLTVIAPLPAARDLTGDDYGHSAEAEADHWLADLSQRRRPDGLEVIADTAVANGAYLPALEALGGGGVRSDAVAYLAWNTAGNTLGTATALLALVPLMTSPVQATRGFRLERMIDDVAYQSVVRHELVDWVKERRGDPHRMAPELAREAEAWLGQRLPEVAAENGWIPEGLAWQVTLPWDRTFECDVALNE